MERNHGNLFNSEALSFDSTLEELIDVDFLQSPSYVAMDVGSDVPVNTRSNDQDELTVEQMYDENFVEVIDEESENVILEQSLEEKRDIDFMYGLDVPVEACGKTVEETDVENADNKSMVSNNEKQGNLIDSESKIDNKKEKELEGNVTCKDGGVEPEKSHRKSKSSKRNEKHADLKTSDGSITEKPLPNPDFEKLKKMRKKKIADASKAPRPPSASTQAKFLEEKRKQRDRHRDSLKRKTDNISPASEPPLKVSKNDITLTKNVAKHVADGSNKKMSTSELCAKSMNADPSHSDKHLKEKSKKDLNSSKRVKPEKVSTEECSSSNAYNSDSPVIRLETKDLSSTKDGFNEKHVSAVVPKTKSELVATSSSIDKVEIRPNTPNAMETKSDAESVGASTDMDEIEMSDMRVVDEDGDGQDSAVEQQEFIEDVDDKHIPPVKDDNNGYDSKDISGASTGIISEGSSLTEVNTLERTDETNQDETIDTVESNDENRKQSARDYYSDSEEDLNDDELHAMLEEGMTTEEARAKRDAHAKAGEIIHKVILEGKQRYVLYKPFVFLFQDLQM